MISELEPIWKQFAETYDALRQALAGVPDDRLHWKPGPQATTVAEITQHIAGGNRRYAAMIDGSTVTRGPLEEAPDRGRLLAEIIDAFSCVRMPSPSDRGGIRSSRPGRRGL